MARLRRSHSARTGHGSRCMGSVTSLALASTHHQHGRGCTRRVAPPVLVITPTRIVAGAKDFIRAPRALAASHTSETRGCVRAPGIAFLANSEKRFVLCVSVVNGFYGCMSTCTASAASMLTADGCCDDQSSGVIHNRRPVIAGRAPLRHLLASASKYRASSGWFQG